MKLKVIGNIKKGESHIIADTYKIINKNKNISYVDNGEGILEFKKESGVTISLGNHITTLSSSIQSSSNNLSNLLKIIKEARNSVRNKQLTFSLSIFFIITQLFGLYILAQKSTGYANVHLFFLDFAVLLGLCYSQAKVRGNFKQLPNSRSIYNRKFLSLIGTITLYGLVCLSFVAWMMRKTKFY